MNRRQFLTLGAVASGTFAVGGLSRMGSGPVAAQISAPPTVDRLVLTNVVDNLYDIFARGGRLDTVTVERTPLGKTPLLAEHGLAYHIDSLTGRGAPADPAGLQPHRLEPVQQLPRARHRSLRGRRAGAEPRAHGSLWRPARAGRGRPGEVRSRG